jgi:hypothetical protein
MAAIAMVALSTPALAQTFTVSPRWGNSSMVQGSDGSVYHYSFAPDGSYLVQKDGASGSYQASPPRENGYVIQGVGQPDWALPAIVPPTQQP